MTLKLKRPAVLFEGGPWDGWSRYLDEIDELRRIEERTDYVFPYRATDRKAIHPRTGASRGGVESQVWEYTGADRHT